VTLALLPSDVDVVVVIIDVVGEVVVAEVVVVVVVGSKQERQLPVRVSSSSVNFSCAGAAALRECGVVARTDKLTGSGTSRCLSSVDACMTGVYT